MVQMIRRVCGFIISKILRSVSPRIIWLWIYNIVIGCVEVGRLAGDDGDDKTKMKNNHPFEIFKPTYFYYSNSDAINFGTKRNDFNFCRHRFFHSALISSFNGNSANIL